MTDRTRRRSEMDRAQLLDFLATASWRLARYVALREKLNDHIDEARDDVRIAQQAIERFNLDADLVRADH